MPGPKTVPIVISIPDGRYCAKFFDMEGTVTNLITKETYPNIVLIEECLLLKVCAHDRSSNVKTNSYYCPIANSDTHCGGDDTGILKQDDYYDSICPSLYGDKIMNLLRGISKLEGQLKEQSKETLK